MMGGGRPVGAVPRSGSEGMGQGATANSNML